MSRDPHPLDELAKALTARTMTRRSAIFAFAGAIVTSARLGHSDPSPGRHQSRVAAQADALMLPAASEPVCDVGEGVACSAKCAAVAAKCFAEMLEGDASCAAEVAEQCDCDHDWDCQCPDGTTPCGLAGTHGGGLTCCDAGQTCYPPGYCVGPCDTQKCERATFAGCVDCEGFDHTSPPSSTCCSGKCVNTNDDNNNCGSCDNGCPSGQICCSGNCVNTQTDANNCGSCGNACTGGETCDGGVCSCGGQTCGDDYECCGGACSPAGSTPCGTGGLCCASDQTCCTYEQDAICLDAGWTCCIGGAGMGCGPGSTCCGTIPEQVCCISGCPVCCTYDTGSYCCASGDCESEDACPDGSFCQCQPDLCGVA
jgi:Stigma-specific protein, Stig1